MGRSGDSGARRLAGATGSFTGAGAGGGFSIGGGLRLRSGLTSRNAACQSSESPRFAIDENDMEAARTVRAELDSLLDVAGA